MEISYLRRVIIEKDGEAEGEGAGGPKEWEALGVGL